MTIMAGRSLLTALLFYWVYNERLKAKHLVGMILLVLCIVLIAIGTNQKSGDRDEAPSTGA